MKEFDQLKPVKCDVVEEKDGIYEVCVDENNRVIHKKKLIPA